MREFSTLKDFFWANRWNYLGGIIFLIAVDFLQLLPPKILGAFADLYQTKQLTKQVILKYFLLLTIIAILIALLRFLWRYYIQRSSRALEMYLRNKLYAHLQCLDAKYYDQHRIGDLMAHATNDINAIKSTFMIGLVMIIDAVVLTTATVLLMFKTIDLRLVLAALMPLPFVAFLAVRFSHLLHNRYLKVQEAFSSLTEQTQEYIAGIRVIKSFALENSAREQFQIINQNNAQSNLNLVRLSALLSPLIQFFASLSFLIVFGYGGYLILQQQISLGSFVAANGYLSMLIWPLTALGWVFSVIQRGVASMVRINLILQTETSIQEAPDAFEIKDTNGQITYQNLDFAYDGYPNLVLKNINLKILPGQTIGIVGKTGSGKSTLVNLLLRIYDPPNSSIYLDGQDVKKVLLDSLRSQIGYVPQDSFLFSTTIEENILLGQIAKESFSLEELIRICHLADDLASLPGGVKTVIGERGVTLSGGQKQRIALARALVNNPPVLILDDSLSAVDTRTEEIILHNLKQIRSNKTTLMIAHRFSTIKHADQIFLLEQGKIVEQGTHKELVNRKGLYYQTYRKQLLEKEYLAKCEDK
ncbi:ABC transporter ATP-binding protein [Bacillota bacterium LX-D]|nr:ABC transporter ATP-binding protein [Bacillota bacterium LX-D]